MFVPEINYPSKEISDKEKNRGSTTWGQLDLKTKSYLVRPLSGENILNLKNTTFSGRSILLPSRNAVKIFAAIDN